MIDLTKADGKVTTRLKQAYLNQKLAHAYLFVDPLTTRALATAYWLACLDNCLAPQTSRPDGSCRNCERILTGNHPDVFLVRPEGKQSLSIDQIRPLKEELAKSPAEGNRRFFFIEQAQALTLSAANALLNLLEEPVAPVTTILLTNNAEQILPTVRSRVQLVEFSENIGHSKTDELLLFGFSEDEITNLANSSDLEQMVKYFYQELSSNNQLAFVSAHKLASYIKTSEQEKYLWFLLKKYCQAGLLKNSQGLDGQILEKITETDKMQKSNVSLLNRLDYLVLS